MKTAFLLPFADDKSVCPRVQRQAKTATIAVVSSNDGSLFEVMRETVSFLALDRLTLLEN